MLDVPDGVTVLIGDALERLREMPDGSVDCVATSPPFFGLRDYGTGRWEGGDEGCDHSGRKNHDHAGDVGPRNAQGDAFRNSARYVDQGEAATTSCGKCGAKRVDDQIGLEDTPDEWVARLVVVFAECRRVLADHGTMWVEIGTSYASNPSGGMTGSTLSKGGKQTPYSRAARGSAPSRAPSPPSARACGSDGRAPQGSSDPDCAYPDLDDERQAETHFRRDRSERIGQLLELAGRLDVPKARGISLAGSVLGDVAAVPRAARESSTPSSSRSTHSPQPTASVSPPEPRSSSPDVQASARTEGCMSGSERSASASRSQGRDASGTACLAFKPKDIIMQPFYLAEALRLDGWWLRQCIIWHKPNCMPESARDRCTTAHSYVFLLTKRPRYWYDADAIAEPAGENTHSRGTKLSPPKEAAGVAAGNGHEGWAASTSEIVFDRNARSVWQIPTQGYPGAHYATWPIALATRMIRAGCPREVCRVCGVPRSRIVERDPAIVMAPGSEYGNGAGRNDGGRSQLVGAGAKTLGWTDCGCGDAVWLDGLDRWRPGIILDPFGGSGTTGVAALREHRHAVLIELNESYVAEQMVPRLRDWHKEPARTRDEQIDGQTSLLELL